MGPSALLPAFRRVPDSPAGLPGGNSPLILETGGVDFAADLLNGERLYVHEGGFLGDPVCSDQGCFFKSAEVTLLAGWVV